MSEDLPPLPRSFRYLVLTRAGEGFGDSLAGTIMPILAVSVLGLGTGYVGVLNSIDLGTFLLLGVPIGMIIDRMRRRGTAMTMATSMRCLVLASLLALYLTQTLSGPVLLLAAGIIGIADVVFTTAETTVIPALVPKKRLKHAYSRLAVTSQSASAAAADTGSLALGFLGMPRMITLAVTSYVSSLLSQLGIQAPAQPETMQIRPKARLRDGFVALWEIPALRALTTSAALTNAGVMLGNTILPVFILSDLDVSPAIYAALGVISTIGAIIGAGLAPRLSGHNGLRRLRIACALVAVPAVLLAVFCQQLPGPELIWLAIQGLSWNLLVSISAVSGAEVLPKTISQEQLASVAASQRTITLGIMPISALIGGALGTVTGSVPMLVVWAGLAGLAALPILAEGSLEDYR